MTTSQQIAKILLKIKAVTLNIKEPFIYSSGIMSPIYCDNRLLLGYPLYRRKVRDAFINLIKANKLTFDVIGGVATAGIPHAAWLAEALRKPMIYIRSKSKGYGKNKLIEGCLSKGQKVLIIDDLISTGSNCLEAVETVHLEGAKARDCLAIFTYGLKKAIHNFKTASANLYTITNLTILLEEAVREGYINQSGRANVLIWAKDPEDWYQKK